MALSTSNSYFYSDGTLTDVAGSTASLETDAYMTKSVTRRGILATSSLKQIAFYKNQEKGEELIDWSIEYSYDGTKTKTNTFYTYDTATNKTDCLRNVTVYKSEFAYIAGQLTTATRPTPAATTMKSSTAYVGDQKGEEIIDYTDNYIVGNAPGNCNFH